MGNPMFNRVVIRPQGLGCYPGGGLENMTALAQEGKVERKRGSFTTTSEDEV